MYTTIFDDIADKGKDLNSVQCVEIYTARNIMALAKNITVLLIVLVVQVIIAVTGYKSSVMYQVREMVKENIANSHRVLDEIIRTGPPVLSTISRLSDPEEDQETKRENQQWKHWTDCKNSMRPQRECDVYYEQTLLKKEDLITRLKYYYKLWNEIVYSNIDLTTASKKEISDWKDKKERVYNMEPDLYPWLDIHNMCTKTNLPKDACYELIKNLRSSKNKDLQPRYLAMAAEAYLCTMSGKAEENCKLEVLGKKPKDEL